MVDANKLDDMTRDYLAMGIIEEEDLKTDVFPCQKCGWSVMPWYLRCEACGDPHPREPKSEDDEETWRCGDDYDEEDY